MERSAESAGQAADGPGIDRTEGDCDTACPKMRFTVHRIGERGMSGSDTRVWDMTSEDDGSRLHRNIRAVFMYKNTRRHVPEDPIL